MSSDNVTIMNTTFENNSSGLGGALYVVGTTNATNIFMTNNNASESGAIYIRQGTLNLTDSRITDNTAVYGAGAGEVYGGRLNIGGFVDITATMHMNTGTCCSAITEP